VSIVTESELHTPSLAEFNNSLTLLNIAPVETAKRSIEEIEILIMQEINQLFELVFAINPIFYYSSSPTLIELFCDELHREFWEVQLGDQPEINLMKKIISISYLDNFTKHLKVGLSPAHSHNFILDVISKTKLHARIKIFDTILDKLSRLQNSALMYRTYKQFVNTLT